jgi:hypothetical protein
MLRMMAFQWKGTKSENEERKIRIRVIRVLKSILGSNHTEKCNLPYSHA